MEMKILFIILLISISYGQRPYLGSCPNVRSAKNVKIDKFLGKWYEIERSFYIYEIPTSCTTVDISRPDNVTKELKISIKTFNRWTGRSIDNIGRATPKGDGSAVLDYRVNSNLPDFIARLLPGVGRYTLLATDHDNFAVIYTCSDLRLLHADTVWILGRKPEIPPISRAQAYDVITRNGLGTDHLHKSNRKDCQEL
ncbi:Apolipoprotein D precursor, putative [Pediculus humanus corporis]|uniref:Apolipoprotein D, putative n=1 Tax=Pediculus humanus subsp. corporis TaxID=121224 RepID=E0VI27_PEDHC|nr:Apolipoprotein D precursor, putative [Pediculus humanus corporis]EEB13033.1 Apolipoprotein D precursor, putative [Pediculus humanus corporis]